VKVVIVDYLQLLNEESGSRSREDAVRRLSNGLKNLAKELGICVVALAQLNRRSAKNTTSEAPNLSDLRDSGSIEQDANVVLLLHRKVQADESPGDVVDVDCIVAKCRGGQIGNISMEYHSPTTHFVEREYF
jgi:replicative DNA helicase